MALPGLALGGAKDQQAAAEFDRQPALTRLSDDARDRVDRSGRMTLSQVEDRLRASAGDPRPRMIEALGRILQPGQPVGGGLQLPGRSPCLDEVRRERVATGIGDASPSKTLERRVRVARSQRDYLPQDPRRPPAGKRAMISSDSEASSSSTTLIHAARGPSS
jgi:hypothetical protein